MHLVSLCHAKFYHIFNVYSTYFNMTGDLLSISDVKSSEVDTSEPYPFICFTNFFLQMLPLLPSTCGSCPSISAQPEKRRNDCTCLALLIIDGDFAISTDCFRYDPQIFKYLFVVCAENNVRIKNESEDIVETL